MSVAVDAGARAAIAPATRRGRRFHRCSCGRPIPEEVKRCSSRTCPEFAPIWARDTRRRLFVNLEQLKLSVMFSVTAPGPTSIRSILGSVRTRPVKDALAVSAVGSLPTLARGVQPPARASGGASSTGPRRCGPIGRPGSRASSRRACGRSRSADSRICTASSRSSRQRTSWAEAYVTALRELAPRYGFGFVDGWHKVGRKFWPGVQAAAYLSSYFAGGRGRKMAITENVLAGDLPRLVVFVGRDLTQPTGCTMRSLRTRDGSGRPARAEKLFG